MKLTWQLQNISLPSHCCSSRAGAGAVTAAGAAFSLSPQSNPPGCCFCSSRLASRRSSRVLCCAARSMRASVRACVASVSLFLWCLCVCVCGVCLWCALKGKQFACSTVSLSVSQSVSRSVCLSDRACVSERVATVLCVSERANLTQSRFYSLQHISFE